MGRDPNAAGRSWLNDAVRRIMLGLRRWNRHSRTPARLPGTRGRDPRARFWSELREGQREAAARSQGGKLPPT
jgi:hypothetical protein